MESARIVILLSQYVSGLFDSIDGKRKDEMAQYRCPSWKGVVVNAFTNESRNEDCLSVRIQPTCNTNSVTRVSKTQSAT